MRSSNIIFVVFAIVFFIIIISASFNSCSSSQIEQETLQKVGSIDNFLRINGFGYKTYEKFDENEFQTIGVSDIISFYKRNGYEIQIIYNKSKYCVEYHAIKIK